MSDEQLRQLYARATSGRAEPRRAECPTPEALEALARREGFEEERLATLDHAMTCADCRQELELLRAIEQARRAETAAPTVRVRWGRPLVLALGTALAAAVAFVAVVRPWSARHGREPAPVMRGAATDVRLTAPAADTVISAGGITFVWRSVPDARRYALEVLTPAGAVRARRETTDTSAAIAAAELGTGDLRWTVRAELDGGELHSPTRRLRVGSP